MPGEWLAACWPLGLAGSRTPTSSPCVLVHCVQTVPTCPALYRNTFTYHTVEHAPPEFEECFNFLGETGCGTGPTGAVQQQPGAVSSGIAPHLTAGAWGEAGWQAAVAAVVRQGLLTKLLCLYVAFARADEVLKSQQKVLVYCMSGITR